jgi:hypothetical protein
LSALDELNAVVFRWKNMNGTVIKPTLHRRANGPNYWYRLQIVEDWGILGDSSNNMPSNKLDDCIKWVEEKLKDWPDCDRKAWDMWDFKKRKDAEKFITLFHLSWQQ